MNYREAQSMVECARTVGKTLGVAYYRRTYSKLARAKELLRQGVIGQAVLAYITCHEWRTGAEAERGWRFDPASGGRWPAV